MKLSPTFVAATLAMGAFTISPAFALEAPAPDSDQGQLLAPYRAYLDRAGCCSSADTRGGFDQRIEMTGPNDANGNPTAHYKVLLDPKVYGEPGEAFWLDIPEDKVRSDEWIEKKNKECAATNDPTCIKPPLAILWAIPGSSYPQGWHVYCFLPDKGSASLEPKTKFATRVNEQRFAPL